ncbi:MAG: NTP transferase domain-containing protein [Syntrophaceae bacterium]|nr:NTP transferase domain-containing protein [Syntrophaceae bacterium]
MKGENERMAQKRKRFKTLILAAGKGTRMGSDLAKVLHRIHGRPLLDYVIEVAQRAGSEEIVAIVGHQAGLVKETFAGRKLVFVEQREQLGTGHAVLQARDVFAGYDGEVLILCGDVPLLPLTTIEQLIGEHAASGAVVSVLTAHVDNPKGYGRIVKDGAGTLKKIVEERDATDEERVIREINSGIYLVGASFLFDAVSRITNDNNQKEYYLTDIIEMANRKGLVVHACLAEDARSVMGINTPDELQQAADYLGELEGRTD